MIHAKKREAATMQARVSQAIQEEFRTREEAEGRLRKQVNDKAQQVRHEIQREAELGEQALQTLNRYLEEDIPTMYEAIK